LTAPPPGARLAGAANPRQASGVGGSGHGHPEKTRSSEIARGEKTSGDRFVKKIRPQIAVAQAVEENGHRQIALRRGGKESRTHAAQREKGGDSHARSDENRGGEAEGRQTPDRSS
jgi:hypothetical protein